MSLVRFDLPQEMDDLRREVNRIFSTMPILGVPFSGDRWIPALDTVRHNGKLLVTVDLPGLSEKDIDVEVHDDQLFIRGTRHIEREKDGQDWYRLERATGEFERCLQMPEGIDPGKVKASFDKGVLTVTVPVPKRVMPEGRHIEITSGSRS